MKFNWLLFLYSWGAILNAVCVGRFAGMGDIGSALLHELVAVVCFVVVVLYATIWKPKERS